MFSKVTTSLSSTFWKFVVVGFLIPAMTVFFQTRSFCTTKQRLRHNFLPKSRQTQIGEICAILLAHSMSLLCFICFLGCHFFLASTWIGSFWGPNVIRCHVKDPELWWLLNRDTRTENKYPKRHKTRQTSTTGSLQLRFSTVFRTFK